MKSRDRIITAIRSRKDLPSVHVSLKKLLEKGGMGHYLNLCSDRLADELMIDGEDISFNFADFPDVLFTSDGLFDCRHILENYLPADMLIDAWQVLIEVERRDDEINSLVAKLRKMKLSELLKNYMEPPSGEDVETGQLIRELIATELWSRSLFSGIQRKVKEALTDLYVRVKFRGLFNIIRNAAESHG